MSKQEDEERDDDLENEDDEDEDLDAAEDEDEDEDEDAAEDEDEDVEDDVEDEPLAAAAPPPGHHAPRGHHGAPPRAEDGAEDPTWWLPHAVLATLVLLGVAGFFGAFSSFVKSPLSATSASANASASAAPAATTEPVPMRPTAKPRPGVPTQDPNDPIFAAKQILVQYKGAAKSTQTRSKGDAKKRADEALAKIKGGAKFEDVVKDYSDEPGAAARGGLLGRFKRGVLPPPVQAVFEKTEVGKPTEVVESEAGFHILLRTQ